MNRTRILAAAAASVLLLPTPQVSAQVGIALTGGVNFASMSVAGNTDISGVRGVKRFSLGMTTTIPLSRNFGIELGGARSQKGGRLDAADEGRPVIVHMAHNEFTLMGRATLSLAEEGIRAYLSAGPSVAWESSCELRIGTTPAGPPWEVRPCRTDDFRDRDFGLAGGVGIEVSLSTALGIALGVGYVHGLRDLAGSYHEEQFKLRTASVRGGFVYWIR